MSDLKKRAHEEGKVLYPNKMRDIYLRSYGFRPDAVIDVGVSDGTRWLYRAYEDVKFVLVDPHAGCESIVRDKKLLIDFDFHAVALGSETDRGVLNVPQRGDLVDTSMSSLMTRKGKMTTNLEIVDQIDVPIVRLDDLAQEYPGRLGLKIDTEGFEINVLAGGPETLKRCDFVVLEMAMTDRFVGVAPPSGCIALLAQAGLELRDVLAVAHDGPGNKAHPRHMDLMFTRWAA